VIGDVRASDRIEIKKNASVVGDLTTAKIMIEEGSYFKGTVEIDSKGPQIGTDLNSLLSGAKKPEEE
jgi:cytoskeletal protein CcmA (bactofilin family)